jgi:phosphoglycolate phosphatase
LELSQGQGVHFTLQRVTDCSIKMKGAVMQPCVIFDLDGTLADTSGDLIAAANACFRGLGMGDVLDPATDAATALCGGRAMLRLGLARHAALDEALVDQQYPVLLAAYAQAIDTHSYLYEGAMDAVATLKSSGYAVGIATNKPHHLADMLLHKLGVRGEFGSLIGADTLAVRKPDPAHHIAAVTRAGGDPARSLLVGDTVTDRDTARNAGVPSVLVTFGPGRAAVLALDADAVIDHYTQLPEVVTRLIGAA